ncbi:MAG: phosphatidylserine decarboxylase [Proteobacteria bacterium]|nr:phosphatidylserine decarboxylase [Pseudomonadota bacterium]
MKYSARLFVALQWLLPKHLVSDLVGYLTRLEGGVLTRVAIRVFVRLFGVDMSDAREPDCNAYPSFNAFFTRALRDGARPIVDDPEAFVCPADGTLSEFGALNGDRLVQAKGIDYTLLDLFDGDAELAARFDGGHFATIYLAPYNYHRVHMPCTATAKVLRYVPGELFSVNATTARGVPGLFCRNERSIVVFEAGPHSLALIMVGALNVGSIELVLPRAQPACNRPHNNQPAHVSQALDGPTLERGAEFGRFNMGSTVVVTTSRGWLNWHEDARAGLPVRMGAWLGRTTTLDARRD